MNPQNQISQAERDLPVSATAPVRLLPLTPRIPSNTETSISRFKRRIAIAVDLSDESAYTVRWAVENYLRPGEDVILLHVRPTSVLYGADWGSIKLQINNNHENTTEPVNPNGQDVEQESQKLEDDYEKFTTTKANNLAQPLEEAEIPFRIHIVKDHDMKQRLCLEVERLGLSTMIMGCRGFGAASTINKFKKLGSVSDYCLQHCVCPVVVVGYPGNENPSSDVKTESAPLMFGEDMELPPVPEEEPENHDSED